jgi:hypothetical protein
MLAEPPKEILWRFFFALGEDIMSRLFIRKSGFFILTVFLGSMTWALISPSFETVVAETQGGAPGKSSQSEPPTNFNHDATSFPLLGAHRGLKCSECHLGGKYKNAPRNCENCHNNQIAYGKPKTHIPTTQGCDLCHSVSAFSPATFKHNFALVTGQCSTCHNGQKATGKPSNHITTTAQCDTCHKTTGWIPAGYVHDASAVGQCSTCHNGQKATGKPSNHITTTSQCDTCHKTTGWTPAGFTHDASTAGQCATCHKVGGPGLPPTTDVVHNNLAGQDCSSCHSSTTSFTTVKMNHTGIVAPCSTCHYRGNSVGAVFKPSNHMVTTQECNLCHAGTTTFANGIFNHSGLTGQLCSSCHKTGGSGMAPKNDVVHNNLAGQDCSSCHSSTTSFTTVKMNHTGIVAPCSTCHYRGNSVGAVSKPNDHPSTSDDCGACHTTTTFNK